MPLQERGHPDYSKPLLFRLSAVQRRSIEGAIVAIGPAALVVAVPIGWLLLQAAETGGMPASPKPVF